MKKVLLAEMTSPEFQAVLRETDTVIVPVGSTEVLGRHGPLGADHLIAAELARRLGEQTGCPAAPVVPYGDALELRRWPGTISVRFDVLKMLYLDICESLLRHGVRRLFFLNTHLMNLRAVDWCGRTLRARGVPVAQADWWRVAFAAAEDLIESANSPKGHGGELITSVVLAVCPELVDRAAAVEEQPAEALAWHLPHGATSGGPFYTYPDFTDFCVSGAWGDPGAATAEKGRLILERGVRRMAQFLREFREQPLPPPAGEE